MAGLPPFLLDAMGVDVTVKPYAGVTGSGDTRYRPDLAVRALVDDTRRYVRSANGDQVISETTVSLPLGTDCPPNSLIELPNRTSTVITVATIDGGTLPVPSHLEAYLR